MRKLISICLECNGVGYSYWSHDPNILYDGLEIICSHCNGKGKFYERDSKLSRAELLAKVLQAVEQYERQEAV